MRRGGKVFRETVWNIYWFAYHCVLLAAIRLGWKESHVLRSVGLNPRNYYARVSSMGISWTPKPSEKKRLQKEAEERARNFKEFMETIQGK